MQTAAPWLQSAICRQIAFDRAGRDGQRQTLARFRTAQRKVHARREAPTIPVVSYCLTGMLQKEASRSLHPGSWLLQSKSPAKTCPRIVPVRAWVELTF